MFTRNFKAKSSTITIMALAFCAQAAAQPWQFVTVADSNTTIPGSTAKFGGLGGNGFFEPSITSGRIAFVGRGVGTPTISGVFAWQDGVLSRIADQTTPYPGGGTFNEFSLRTSLSADSIAFTGSAPPASGGTAGAFYTSPSGIVKAADFNTPIPGGSGNFEDFQRLTKGATSLVFRGSGSGGQVGMYEFNGTNLFIRANTATPIPNGSGSFTAFGAVSRMHGSNLAITGRGANLQEGLFLSTPVGLSVIVDSNTLVPETSGAKFSGLGLGGLDLDGTAGFIATMGGDVSKRPGIYTAQGGTFTRLLGIGDPAPGSGATFQAFDTLSFDNGQALFLAFSEFATQKTLYFRDRDGTVLRILGHGDVLEGRFVDTIGIDQQSLSGDQLTFYARMSGNFEGIYTLTVPGPGGLALGALGLAAGMGRRRA